jgi:hypothetical protein
MSTDIERLLYSERQYLQSSDFTDEQTYHLEMRRRLNLALHLWGIVKGLELLKGAVVQGTPDQYYVSEGLAIDAYGREIIVPAKHQLSDDFGANHITGAGTYSVWIGYTREQTTPPQSGFQSCNQTIPYTRWRESYQISITSLATNPNPAEDPDPFGTLPDDPTKYPWLIHLGTITIDSSLSITAATNANRIYIGIRTERIVAPHRAISGYNVLDANKPLHPPTSITVKDNLFLEQNLIAGSDFAVDPQKIQPQPITSPPSTFPSPTGNVKIASDVFLQGNLYTHCDATQPDLWINLDQCIQEQIKNSVPEVHIGTATAQFAPVASRDSSGAISASVNVTITPQLTQIDDSKNSITTAIAGIIGKSLEHGDAGVGRLLRGQIVTGVAANTERFEILTAGSLSLNADGTGTYNAALTCTIGPAQSIGSQPQQYDVPVDSVLISYVVIFSPKQ